MNDDKLIECAKIGRTVGLAGDLLIYWYSDSPPVSVGDEIFTSSSEKSRPLIIRSIKRHGNKDKIAFEGILDCDQAKLLVNKLLYISESKLEALEPSEYYSYQLIGMEVFDCDDNRLGILKEIFPTKVHDVYVIADEEGRELMIPAVDKVIIDIDVEEKKMKVKVPEGLAFY